MNTSLDSFARVLNRDFKLPADGWIQLAPFGEVRAPVEQPDGKAGPEIVQVFNRATAERLATTFNRLAAGPNFAGVLIDFDHFSCDQEKSSEAAGWIEQLAVRDDGLWGKCRWSDTGEAALKGGRYRLFSPVLGFTPRKYSPGERVEPTALLRGALTNDPRIKGMLPISNRDGLPAAAAQPQPESKPMKDLNKALGLVDEAPEASALAALTLIKNRATDAEGKVATLTAERDTLLGVQIERDLDQAGLKPGATREQWKTALIKNRADALPLLASLKGSAAAYSVTHNRDQAKTPEGEQPAEQSLDHQRTVAVREYQTRNRCNFQAAWDAVRAEKPTLFAETPVAAE